MIFWRWILFLMVDNVIAMSWHFFPESNFQYNWANACDHWRIGWWMLVIVLSQWFRWSLSRAAAIGVIIHVLFELLEIFDELKSGNVVPPWAEFSAYFVLLVIVIVARYQHGDRPLKR